MTAADTLRIVEFGQTSMEVLADTLRHAISEECPAGDDELTMRLIDALQKRQQDRATVIVGAIP